MKRLEFVLKTTITDYYKVLGVVPIATTKQIKDAYYKLCWEHHPDRGGDAVHMAEITEAYSVLGDTAKRKAFDAKRKFLSKPCGTCKGEGVTYRQKSFTKREAIPCRTCGGSGIQGGKQ